MQNLLKQSFLTYILAFIATCSIAFLLYQGNFFKKNRFELPYSTSEPIFIPYPKGTKLGQINAVTISNLEQKSLWISSNALLHLDLSTKNMDFFTNHYGIKGNWNYWENNAFLADSISRSIWYSQGNYTYRVEVDKKLTHEYNYVGKFLTLLRQKDKVWVGTSQGLFQFDEKSNQLIGVSAVCNIAVKILENNQDNSLIINNIYNFNVSQNLLENIPYTSIPKINNKSVKDLYTYDDDETNGDAYTQESIDEKAMAQKPKLLFSVKNTKIYNYDAQHVFIVQNEKDTSFLEEGREGLLGLEDSCYWYINDNKSFAYFNYKNNTKNVFYADIKEHFLPTSLTRDEKENTYYQKENFCFDERYIWYSYASQLYCFDKKEKHFWQIYHLGTEQILNIKSYGDNLLIFGEYKVVVASKENLIRRKIPLQSPKLKEEPKVYAFQKELNDSLQNKTQILERIAILEAFKVKYSADPDSAIQYEITKFASYLSFHYSDTVSYNNARNCIDKGTPIKSEYKAVLYESVIKASTIWARITMANAYFEKMKQEGITSDDYFKNEMNYAIKAKYSLDSLRNLNLPEDQTLWATGKIILHLFDSISWNDGSYGELYAERSAGLDFFRQVYSKYPQSEWADDTDWQVNGDCLGYDSCGPPSGSESCISYCQNFLNRYPSTNLKKEVYRCIVSNYRYMDGEGEFTLKNVRAGIAFAKKALAEFPKLKNEQESIYYEMQEMQDALKNLAWELKASLNKEMYKKNESIVVKVTLLRNDATPEASEIEFKTNAPNCHIQLYDNYRNEISDDFFRENPYCPEVKFTKKKLSPGQKITEQFDLLKIARISDYIKDGLFILPQGEYHLKVIWEGIAASEEISFSVE